MVNVNSYGKIGLKDIIKGIREIFKNNNTNNGVISKKVQYVVASQDSKYIYCLEDGISNKKEPKKAKNIAKNIKAEQVEQKEVNKHISNKNDNSLSDREI